MKRYLFLFSEQLKIILALSKTKLVSGLFNGEIEIKIILKIISSKFLATSPIDKH